MSFKKKPEDESNLGFGKIFSDYMSLRDIPRDRAGNDAEIKKYEDFKVSPAATVFHYGQEVFEGLKAYRQVNGDIALFRAKDNFRRLNNSAKRLAMPQIDEEFAHRDAARACEDEQDWVPHEKGTSVYPPELYGDGSVHRRFRRKRICVLYHDGSGRRILCARSRTGQDFN